MEQKEFMPNENKPNRWFIGVFVALLAALLLSTMAGETIKNLFRSLISGLTPLIIAVIIAFLFLRPMNFIENKLLRNRFVGNSNAQKYKRAISMTFLYLVTLGVIAGVLIATFPSIVTMIQQFADPSQSEALIEKLKEMIVSIVQFFGMSEDEAVNTANSIAEAIKNYFADLSNSFNLENVIGIGQTFFSVIMGFLIAFFLLKDKELIAKTSRRFAYAYRPRKKAEELIILTRRTREMLDQYVISNLIIGFIVFIIAWVGYAIMGVPYAFLMALILGVLNFIPYIGGFIAAIPLLMVTLLTGDMSLFLMAFAYGIAEWALVTTFLPPLILSKRMNTRALVMILALTLGGAMFGVVGMILSGPVAAVISVVINERLQVRESMREHEELVQAGVIDKNFYDVSEMLDLTQDTEANLTIEQEEDDFKRLQALKHKKKEEIPLIERQDIKSKKSSNTTSRKPNLKEKSELEKDITIGE